MNLDFTPGNLIVCDGVKVACTFDKLIELVKVLINDLVILSTVLATMAVVYAGFMLVTSGGDTGKIKSAKAILMKILIGYLWILGAWLLVYTITTTLLNSDYTFILGKPTP